MDEAQLISLNELKVPKRYCGQDMHRLITQSSDRRGNGPGVSDSVSWERSQGRVNCQTVGKQGMSYYAVFGSVY